MENNQLSSLETNKYKDTTPENTVDKIRGILKKINVEVVEEWAPESTISTFSLRLNIKDTNIGTNGKGVTKEYARASAYAEFLERLQNNMKMTGNSTLCNVLRDNQSEFLLYQDEKLCTSEEILEENNSFIRMFCENQSIFKEKDNEGLKKGLMNVQKMDYNLLRQRNQYLCIPYYSIKNDNIANIPYFASNLHYGSNGMCAGNTASEALVQGLSEIVERFIQRKIVMEQIKLPTVPVEFLKKNDTIYQMYKTTQELNEYEVIIKDASLNGKYSAVVLVIVEKNTGKFGIKVGSHPDYMIAIERLFTEATQGISLENFAKKTVFDFSNRGVSVQENIVNGFKTSDALYPYQLLCDEADYSFVEPTNVSNLSNDQMLTLMTDLFLKEGYDILIHDVSFLGFPSYHIIVPGFSEMSYPKLSNFEAENTRFHIQQLLDKPEYITKDNCKYVISVLNFYKHSLMNNTISNLTGRFSKEDYPAKEVGLDHYYMLSMCYAFLGEYEAARREIWAINISIIQRGLKENIQYKCIEYYFAGMAVLANHAGVMSYLYKLFDEEICEQINQLFIEPEKILTKQYPSFDMNQVNHHEEYIVFRNLFNRLKEEQKEHMIHQLELRELFA